MRWSVIAVLVAGCYDPSKQLCVDCLDAPPVPPDLSASGVCAGVPEGLLPNTCFDPVPHGTLTLPAEIDTSTFACDAPKIGDTDELCFIAAEMLVIDQTVRVRGKRPLVLWSATNITISLGAVLDVGSHVSGGTTSLGAGANSTDCPNDLDGASVAIPAMGLDLGVGGCGGPFGGRGGVGGAAAQGLVSVPSNCTPERIMLDKVRGGCRGGHGGISNSVGSLNGGGSGGAVYLMARADIIVAGTIDARGARGRVASVNPTKLPGGGGGGSGGLIAFDTGGMVILNLAALNALGGGGSSGAGMVSSAPVAGNDGTDPGLSPPTVAINSSETVPNNFGSGSTEFLGGAGGSPTDPEVGGGGGGGGGPGQIRAYPKAPMQLNGSKVIPAFAED